MRRVWWAEAKARQGNKERTVVAVAGWVAEKECEGPSQGCTSGSDSVTEPQRHTVGLS